MIKHPSQIKGARKIIIPCVITDRIDIPIQTTIAATWKKIDWNAWNRMFRFWLYGASTRNRMPVINPSA